MYFFHVRKCYYKGVTINTLEVQCYLQMSMSSSVDVARKVLVKRDEMRLSDER